MPAIAFLAFLLPLAATLPAPSLSYSEAYPEFRPYSGCTVAPAGVPCSYDINIFQLASQFTCLFEQPYWAYYSSSASFSFEAPRKANATLSFWMYDCSSYPTWVPVSVNDCAFQLKNEVVDTHHEGRSLKTIEIGGQCINSGQNMVTLSGQVKYSLGIGNCPQANCQNAPLYAELVIPEEMQVKRTTGNLSIGEASSSYSFLLSIPLSATGKVSLPAYTAITECGGCSVSGSEITMGPGTHPLKYSLPNLELLASFPESHSQFLKNETPQVQLFASFAGSPVSAKLYFSNGSLACDASSGSCEALLPNGIGAHAVEFVAIEGPSGRIGKINLDYSIDPDPEIRLLETAGEASFVANFGITNPTHEIFAPTVSYQLPEDYAGSLAISPFTAYSLNTSNVSFKAPCAPYSNCTYSLSFPIKGVSSAITPVFFPPILRIGQQAVGNGKIIIENTNPKRALRSVGSVPSGCSSGCSWDVTLQPLEKRELEYSFSREGASECRREQLSGAVSLCVSIPNGFPQETSLEYLVPFSYTPGYLGGAEAKLAGQAIPLSLVAGGFLLSLGKLPSGTYHITITYRQEQQNQLPEVKNEPLPDSLSNEQTAEEALLPPSSEQDGLPKRQAGQIGDGTVGNPAISAPIIVSEGELVQLTVLVGEFPAEGEVAIISPSGKSFSIPLSGGRASFAFDEPGIWRIIYGGEEKQVLVGEKSGRVSTESALPGTPSFSASYSTGKPFGIGLELGPWVLLLALLPFLAMPALGYFLFTASKGPLAGIIKRYDGKTVTIEVENRGGPLTDIWITDKLPDDAVLADSGGGSFKKTIFGNVLKWRLPSLGGDGKWKANYGLSTTAKQLGEARLIATDMKGNQIKAESEEPVAS